MVKNHQCLRSLMSNGSGRHNHLRWCDNRPGAENGANTAAFMGKTEVFKLKIVERMRFRVNDL